MDKVLPKSPSMNPELQMWEEPDDKPAEVLGFSWRSEPDGKWVKVKSVVDSGASVPVAPPRRVYSGVMFEFAQCILFKVHSKVQGGNTPPTAHRAPSLRCAR